jgi:photosystem II stability/assembly factor-like uncharacterized protein
MKMYVKTCWLKMGLTFFFAGQFTGNFGAQWAQLHVPYSPNVSSIVASGPNLVAGYRGALAVSTDSGQNWTMVNPSKYDLYSSSISLWAKDTVVYAAFGDHFNRSGSQGRTWDNYTYTGFNDNIVGAAANDSFWFMAVEGQSGGIFRKGGKDQAWNNVNDSLMKKNQILSFTIIGNNLLIGTVGHGIYVSEDNGASWNAAMFIDSGELSLMAFLSSSGKWAFAADDHGFFISADSGKSWNSIGIGLPAPNIYRWWIRSVICIDSVIFVGTLTDVFRSDDTGKTWESTGSGLPVVGDSLTYRKPVYSFAKMGKELFAATDSGVYKSIDNGSFWTAMNKNSNISSINTIAASNENVSLGALIGGFHSADSGDTWKRMNIDEINVLAASGGMLISGKGKGFNTGTVNFSIDNGKTWWNRYFHKTFADAITSLAINGSYIFAGMLGYDGIVVSSDSGENWHQATTGILDPSIASYNVNTYCLASFGNRVFTYSYAPGTSARFFQTVDNGKNWTRIDSGLSPEVYSFAAIGSHYFAGTHIGVYHSSNFGTFWKQGNAGAQPNYVNALATFGNSVFAATAQGVYLTTDYAESWRRIDSGMVDRNVTAMAIQKTNLFAGTADGRIYRAPLSDYVSVNAKRNEVVSRRDGNLMLPKRNGSVVTIAISFAAAGHVFLAVYNLSGRRVAVIADEYLAPGDHEWKWNARHFASGGYILKMQTDFRSESNYVAIFK